MLAAKRADALVQIDKMVREVEHRSRTIEIIRGTKGFNFVPARVFQLIPMIYD